MTEDLPAVPEPETDLVVPSVAEKIGLPPGKSKVHAHRDSEDVWKLCCRIRLDMRDGSITPKDAVAALSMKYPDLQLSVKELTSFMENFVDPYIIVDQTFWKKGLMKSKAKLNTAAEISSVAQRMQNVWEKMEGKVGKEGGPTMREYMAAGKMVAETRKIQSAELAKIGFSPKEPKVEPAKSGSMPVPTPPKSVVFNFYDAVGGSFRRPAPVDAEFKDAEKAPSS